MIITYRLWLRWCCSSSTWITVVMEINSVWVPLLHLCSGSWASCVFSGLPVTGCVSVSIHWYVSCLMLLPSPHTLRLLSLSPSLDVLVDACFWSALASRSHGVPLAQLPLISPVFQLSFPPVLLVWGAENGLLLWVRKLEVKDEFKYREGQSKMF